MKIVTTPMCQEILRLAGVQDFEVTKHPDSTDADIAVVLSETDTNMKSLKIKVNTFSQINESLKEISKVFGTKPLVKDVGCESTAGTSVDPSDNENMKVKVYSNFLGEIVEDMGFMTVSVHQDYLVYPDYMKDELVDEISTMGDRAVELPSHKNAPLNPVERAKLRYNILEKRLCMKL
ncbi:hypothetical protein [Methanobacterium aggregans]|uniref:hypothetical protein n=1 Tax=Methanobacterium aggregans TaxID=1615586 RepID=UPI001AE70E07|nr:hypothetical protein [Methanobacterium aggregans]MBP2046296.1 hypothetical protein [Methanobacterium aggregans]